MILIILAAGLGLQFIVVVLLFRRLRRNLSRQLRDMRAERNSEKILRALQEAPVQHPAMQAANWFGPNPEPVGDPQPVRRKKHLGLYLGGGLAAMSVTVSQVMRETWKSHPVQLVGAVAGAAAAAATVAALLTYTPWRDDSRPPSSAPTAAPSINPPPEDLQPPSIRPSETPSRSPSVSPSASPPGTVPDSPALNPSGPASTAGPSGSTIGGQESAEPGPRPPSSTPPEGATAGPGPSGDDTPPPPGTTPPLPPPVPPAVPVPTQSPDGPCVGVTAVAVAGVVACLLGGG